jgi:hypothetical protein
MKKIMLRIVWIAFVLCALTPSLWAQSIAGDWQGELAPQVLVVLHVTASGNGYSATADSPKQKAFGMPATFTINGNNVSFTIAVPGNPASFTGTRNANTISGTFHQGGGQAPLTLTKSGASGPNANSSGSTAPPNADVAGNWQGDLTPQLSVVLHVTASGNDYSATADSPKQKAFGMPATFTINGKNVSFTIAVPGNPASFTGTRNANTISGTFRQGGGQAPLTLTK